MIKVFMAIIITSMPGWESVRYQGFLYPDLQTCETSTELYVQEYKNYAQSKSLSTTAIYRKVFEGKLNFVKIDGIKFIIKENTSPKAGDSQ